MKIPRIMCIGGAHSVSCSYHVVHGDGTEEPEVFVGERKFSWWERQKQYFRIGWRSIFGKQVES
jgi:hypothetical protein